MKKLQPRTVENAPESARDTLRAIKKGFGFVPNLMATFANAPAVLKGYMAMDAEFEKSSLSPVERQLVLLAASTVNECGYCQAVHSTILKKGLKAEPELVSAVRAGGEISDPRLEAFVRLTKELVSERGRLSEATKAAFLAQGYKEEQLLEVILGIGLKTVSNYVDHVVGAEVDAAFKAEAPGVAA